MLDYYLAMAEYLGCDSSDRPLELTVAPMSKKGRSPIEL